MPEVVNNQKQPIPMYSGIVINITNPTLNAPSVQSCGVSPYDMNAVGINVTNPQVRQNAASPEQQYLSKSAMITPDGYYSQTEISQQQTKLDKNDIKDKSESKSLVSNAQSINSENNSNSRNTENEINNYKELNSLSEQESKSDLKSVQNSESSSNSISNSDNINSYKTVVSDSETSKNTQNAVSEKENTSDLRSVQNSETSSNSLSNSNISNATQSTVSDKETANNVQSSISQKEITKESIIDKTTTDSDIQARAYSSEADSIKDTNAAAQKSDVNSAYPAPYYINNYYENSGKNGEAEKDGDISGNDDLKSDGKSTPDMYDAQTNSEPEEDMSISRDIISDIDAKRAEEIELEKNGKKMKVVALTNEYIMSLENYLNNPNIDIRLMASKEILTRLNEDTDRYDDAALNALLNKMLQDPAKLVRVAALSALSSDLASGNDYTVQILNRIQQDPNSDQEDVLDAAHILLNMSASTEIRYTPVRNTQEAGGE